MPPATPNHRALIALALLTLIWSFNWIVMKQVLAYSGPFEFAALRYVLGTGVLFLVLLARRESLRPPPLVAVIAIGLAQTMGFQALAQWALVEGGAGKTALLAYTMPFWVLLLNWGVFRQRPSRPQTISLVVAMAGLLIVLAPWHGIGTGRSALLAIVSGLCWALGAVLSKRVFARGQTSALSLTAWQMLAGSVGLVALSALVPERAIEWSDFFIAALAYNAILSSGLAWVMWSYVVERLPANTAGLSSLAIPIFGIGLAWAILGERPSLLDAAGIALIVIALLIVTLRTTRAGS